MAGTVSSGSGNSILNALGGASSSSNPIADLVKLGNAPTQGVAATRDFQQTLASALAEILSRVKMSAGSSDDSGNDNSNSIVPDFSKTMMPLQLSLAMNNMQNMSIASRLPSSNDTATSQNNNATSSVTSGGSAPGAKI